MGKFGYEVREIDIGLVDPELGYAVFQNGIKVRPPGSLGYKRRSDAQTKMNQLIKEEEEKRKRMDKQQREMQNVPGALPSFEELNDMF